MKKPGKCPNTIAYDLGHQQGHEKGRAEGLAEAHRQIMAAEALSDKALDDLASQKAAMAHLWPVLDAMDELQSLLADSLLWFDGFDAAFAHREPWERPNIPDRDRIRKANALLQAAAAAPINSPDTPTKLRF